MDTESLKQDLRTLATRDDLPPDVRARLDRAVGSLATPLHTDVWIYRIVVCVLGLTIFATVFGGIYIAIISRGDATMSLPEGIVAIGSAAVGALAGLLAPSPQSR